MAKNAAQTMDENTRRYYLDAMGIQCWESLDAQVTTSQSMVSQSPIENQSNALAAGSSDKDVAASYTEIETAIQACTKCALHKTRKQTLFGRGNLSADLMFVVLSPNEHDEKNALICSGEAGDLFSKMLFAININIDDVYITSLLKCHAPTNHTISSEEIQPCNTHLKQQIQFIQPKIIIVLGENTARCLLHNELSIDESRAMNNPPSQQLVSLPLFFSYSPDELLQQASNKQKAWQDLQQLQKTLENIM